MKSNLITEEEKNRILNMHKKRQANHYLVEQLSSGDPVPDEYKDLIGKNAILKFKKIIKVEDTLNPGDVWYGDALPTNELGSDDKLVYDDAINNIIRGTISNVFGINKGNNAGVVLSLTNISTKLGFGILDGKNKVRYECGTNIFNVDINFSQSKRGDFFKGKVVTVGFTCPLLSDYLEKRLPCGGFDFSKNDTNRLPDTDILPDTLS